MKYVKLDTTYQKYENVIESFLSQFSTSYYAAILSLENIINAIVANII